MNTSRELPVKDGYLHDYISDQRIKATPEEIEAVQVFARQLVEDYGYSKQQIQTRPQWHVKARPSDKSKEYPVDIAVFSDVEKRDDNLLLIVECKKKTRRDGVEQLQDYLRLSRAKLGVWFNGEERLFLKKSEKDGAILFEEVPNIPKAKQRIEDVGQFCRKDLKEPHNLKVVFKAIRNYLAGNTVGATRDEVLAQQLINLIFCKIYDEKFTKRDDMVSFRAGIDEAPRAVRERIENIFEKVKAKYQEVIDFSDRIALDDRSVVYIVGELQNYCITEAERDVVADAFETFIGHALKGGQGQFFTPRNVVKLMVEILDPKPDELIVDPACGSGGFLVESLRHIWTKLDRQAEEYGWNDLALNEEKISKAMNQIRGIEKDEFLSKVTKAYMAIMGDGKGGIFCEDSLEIPKNWKSRTQQSIGLDKFDVVITNPPFGKDIKIIGRDRLAQYELAHKWGLQGKEFEKTNKLEDNMAPDVLFIERCIQLLKDGGRMGIVLPETFFHAPRSRYVMQFMERHNITWLIDLPHNTFRPHNNAKCVVIFLEKNVPQQQMIQMAVAEEMGHDHQGKEIYRWNQKTREIDKENLWDDIALILDELSGKCDRRFTFSVGSSVVHNKRIYVPRYYWETKEEEIERRALKEGFEMISIQQLLDEKVLKAFDGHGSPPSEYKGRGDVPYIRVKDIVNWEIYKDPTAKIPEEIYLQKKGKNKELIEKDVVYVRRGSYRIGSVAMVSPFDTKALLTREILVLRIIEQLNKYGLTPFYLLYLLSHELVAEQALNKVLIETTLPNIADRWKELRLPIHGDASQRKYISDKIEKVMSDKWRAVEQIEEMKKELGNITT